MRWVSRNLISLNVLTRILAMALVVTSGFSVGLRHAHAGGEKEHTHSGVAADSVARYGDNAHEVELDWLESHSHFHLFVLGFQFTFPSGDDAGEDRTLADQLMIVGLMGDDVSDSATRAPSAAEIAVNDLMLPVEIVVEVSPFASHGDPALNLVRAWPLCDNARHERSGVQLA